MFYGLRCHSPHLLRLARCLRATFSLGASCRAILLSEKAHYVLQATPKDFATAESEEAWSGPKHSLLHPFLAIKSLRFPPPPENDAIRLKDG